MEKGYAKEMSERIVKRYSSYADLVEEYSSERNLHLNEKQVSLLEKAINDELTEKDFASLKAEILQTNVENQKIDEDEWGISGIIRKIFHNPKSSFYNTDEEGGLKNKHLLEAYNLGKRALSKEVPRFADGSYNKLRGYLERKGLIKER